MARRKHKDHPASTTQPSSSAVAAGKPHKFSKAAGHLPAPQAPLTPGQIYWRLGKVGLLLVLLVGVLFVVLDISTNVLAGTSSQSIILSSWNSLWAAVTPREERETLAINKTPAPGQAPKGMVWVPGGWFWMGSDDIEDAPVHKVYVDGFWMDKTEVTNEQWQEFVKDTGYRTVAEKAPDPSQFPPNTPREELEKLKPFSLVFTPPKVVYNLRDHRQWWSLEEGANWQHPEGPNSNLEKRLNHPVVHIAWTDAIEYCKWRGQKEKAQYRLPTEAEWEFAARGGLDQKKYCWGDELQPGGKCMTNNWQGRFPAENKLEDGYYGTAPVGSYPGNGYGLHDMAGNVWEWCLDNYDNNYYNESPLKNPRGPQASNDPQEPEAPKRVQRGGSFLCADNYCRRYLPAARGKGDIWSSAAHIGFRCIREAPEVAVKE